jgi:hypothetical protein
VLVDLRRVLGTVSQNFMPDVVARFHLARMAPAAIADHMAAEPQAGALRAFLAECVARIAA